MWNYEQSYYFFGTLFFVAWFVLTILLVAVTVILFRRMQEIQATIEEKLETKQASVMFSLIPLIPSLVDMGNKLRRKG